MEIIYFAFLFVLTILGLPALAIQKIGEKVGIFDQEYSGPPPGALIQSVIISIPLWFGIYGIYYAIRYWVL